MTSFDACNHSTKVGGPH